jgi:predicted outer membrane protein
MSRRLGLFALLAVLGCAGGAREDPPATTSAVVAGSIEAPLAAGPIEPRPVERYTDAEILGLVRTFNTGEIELATLGHDRGRDPRVRAFAAVLKDDHHAALEQEKRLIERLVVRGGATERMRDMRRAADAEATKLRSLHGRDFDVEFVSHQVLQQRDALAMLDLQLIPSARRADIRAHLADFRGRVDHHLSDAKDLERALAGPIIAAR